MSSGELGVIHTKSSYAPDLSVSIVNGKDSMSINIQGAIAHLRDKELQFYHSFFPEVNSLEGFLKKVRELFEANEKDRQIFEGFTNANLQKFLPDYKPPVFERGYKITFIGDAQNINFEKLNTQNDSIIVEVLKGEKSISVVPENAQIIKKIINAGLNRTQNFNAFRDNDTISKNLAKLLSTNESNKIIEDVFEVEVGDAPKRKEIEVFDVVKFASKSNGQGFWKKSDLAKLRKSDRNLPEVQAAIKEIKESINYIKNFLFKDYNSASDSMKKAMDSAWNGIGGNKDILAQDFFFEGENYKKIILGQIGEFSNLVLNYYLKNNRSNKAIPPKLMAIIGSDFENGQQYHSDIEIMLACGADVNQQTKNINEESQIPVNTNALLIAPNFGDEFITPLVNLFANSDYRGATIDDFKKVLEKFYYAAMNLNINDQLNQKQMNTFYFIGGEHLIPASEILKTLDVRTKRPSFNISGGNVSKNSDQGYRENFSDYFYWKYPSGSVDVEPDDMTSTEKNISAYNKAASSISIQTSFSIPALLKSGSFKIFSA